MNTNNRTCPSCSNKDLKCLNYPEGAILICPSCRLQFGLFESDLGDRAVTVRDNGVMRTTGDRYMDPDSIGDPKLYQPYVDFFACLKRFLATKDRLRILDIGCGNGLFIQHCLCLGHDAYGIEINTDLKSLVPSQVAPRVVWGSAEQIKNFPVHEFDVITFWDSFEHMENGFSVLDVYRYRLAAGGLVYLRVNNNRDIFNLVSLLLVKLMPSLGNSIFKDCFGFPSHLWNFSVKGMQNLAVKNAWNVRHYAVGETPASRLSSSRWMLLAIEVAYLVNRLIGGGKIGNYYLTSSLE